MDKDKNEVLLEELPVILEELFKIIYKIIDDTHRHLPVPHLKPQCPAGRFDDCVGYGWGGVWNVVGGSHGTFLS